MNIISCLYWVEGITLHFPITINTLLIFRMFDQISILFNFICFVKLYQMKIFDSIK